MRMQPGAPLRQALVLALTKREEPETPDVGKTITPASNKGTLPDKRLVNNDGKRQDGKRY